MHSPHKSTLYCAVHSAFVKSTTELKLIWVRNSSAITMVQIQKMETQKHKTIFDIFTSGKQTETNDLCQLPCPPHEIHKMIYLPPSVKILKNKLKNLETDESYFYLLHQTKSYNA